MDKYRSWMPVVVLAAILGVAVLGGRQIAQQIAYGVTKGQTEASREQLAEMSKQDTLSPLFATVAKVIKPAVVEVRVTKKVAMPQMPNMDDFFRRFFGDENPPGGLTPRGNGRPTPPRQYFARGLGSGVIVDAREGYVLTNYHVVAGSDETQVVLADGRTFKSKWIRSDPQTDLAIVKIDADGLIEAPLGDSDKMAVGDWVLAFGSPEGLQQTVTAGIISAMGRSTGEANTYQNFIQTDAAINHGNSGGPLVNTRGEVIGINTAIVSPTGANEGIGLAIPSNMAKTIMHQLIAQGKVTRGYLGVTIQNVDDKLARSFKLPDTHGALVAGVAPGSPAEKAGLKVGDFITAVNGQKVDNVNELRNDVAALVPGKSVQVDYYRDGKKAAASVMIEAQPAEMASGLIPSVTPGEAMSSKFGLDVSTMTKDLADKYGYKSLPKGAVITDVTPGSSADNQGLKEGMVIIQAGDHAIATAEDFAKAISDKSAADGIRLRVKDPTGAARFVFITPEKK
ncbi:MAG: DegQ family serine endoprotease [Phycisphaerae bacterium]